MSERAAYAYATIRIVPSLERGEAINAGVLLYCRPRRFLAARVVLDRNRLLALFPALDLAAVERQLTTIVQIAAGDPAGGALALLPPNERFGSLAAPASTVVQPGPVHGGFTNDPESTLDRLINILVR